MSDEELRALIQQHRERGALVDANLLLLYLIGCCNPEWIPRFKRTLKYRKMDFDILYNLLAMFDRIVTTPNVATEVNGLGNQLSGSWKPRFLGEFAARVERIDERLIASVAACKDDAYSKFGLTDAATVTLAREGFLVLTDDAPLYHFLAGRNLECINFTYLRGLTP